MRYSLIYPVPPEKKSKGIPNFVFQRGTSRKISTWTYLQNRNRPTDLENEFIFTSGKE